MSRSGAAGIGTPPPPFSSPFTFCNQSWLKNPALAPPAVQELLVPCAADLLVPSARAQLLVPSARALTVSEQIRLGK